MHLQSTPKSGAGPHGHKPWWNLAPHDVSILLYLMEGALLVSVSAQGVHYIQPKIEDVVFAILTWANRMTAHIKVSWLDPSKTRKMTIVGSRKMLVYDDVSDDKIAVIDKGIDRVPKAGRGWRTTIISTTISYFIAREIFCYHAFISKNLFR